MNTYIILRKNRLIFWFLTASFVTTLVALLYATGIYTLIFNVSYLVLVFSVFLTSQNLFTLTWMLYGWSKPENEQKIRSVELKYNPHYFFTLIVPARNESKVISDTIKTIDQIDYPKNLYEVLIVCTTDDIKTIEAINSASSKISDSNIRLITYDDQLPNKPKALNIGLQQAKGQIVGVFDAEDEAGDCILKIINNTMLVENVDIVQSGVQLMDHNSHWFSSLNVLEYYFWFKSGLHFFSRVFHAVPLGGNTVFFKKELLDKLNGWDTDCLTEDADIGIRASLLGAKIRVIYDDDCLTKEETPSTVKSFINQRTRWMQGFMQILFKGDWLDLPLFRQKIIFLYILTSPIIQSILLFYIPFGIFVIMTAKLTLLITLISYMPFYLMLIQLLMYIIGLYKFAKVHNKEFSINIIFKIILSYYPYQLLLAYSSFRAIARQIGGINIWEKTRHHNNHRNI